MRTGKRASGGVQARMEEAESINATEVNTSGQGECSVPVSPHEHQRPPNAKKAEPRPGAMTKED